MEPILTKSDVIAVFGVSDNPEKYGYKVFFDLLKADYEVFAIHSDGGAVEGVPRYKNLSELPKPASLAIMVIPPEASLAMIKDCVQAGIKKFWLQPGSESDKSIQYCKDNNLQCIYNACILLSK
jgi:hypothetical protein